MKRCSWCNLNNPLYVLYHDEEWGVPKYDDHELYELLILEMFQAGLSWECVLNKREAFRAAFDNFDWEKVVNYGDNKINELMQDRGIIRNKRKIEASINNTKIFIDIQKEFGSFKNFLWGYTNWRVIKGNGKIIASNNLSDKIAKDLQKRGMKFVGTIIIYSYLQAVGIINDHDVDCFRRNDL